MFIAGHRVEIKQHGTYRVLYIFWPAFDESPFLNQLTLEEVRHLICKACTVAFESSCEKGGKFVMRDSRLVLVKVVGFYFLH